MASPFKSAVVNYDLLVKNGPINDRPVIEYGFGQFAILRSLETVSESIDITSDFLKVRGKHWFEDIVTGEAITVAVSYNRSYDSYVDIGERIDRAADYIRSYEEFISMDDVITVVPGRFLYSTVNDIALTYNFDFGKGLSTSISNVVDRLAFGYDTHRDDTFYVYDEFALTPNKIFSEGIDANILSEDVVIAFTYGKVFDDLISTFNDSINFDITTKIVDATDPTDALNLSSTKQFTNSVASVTDFLGDIVLGKYADDAILTSGVMSWDMNQVLQDPVAVTDILSLARDMELADNVVAVDLVGVPDGLTWSVNKTERELISTADGLYILYSKAPVLESITLIDQSLLTPELIRSEPITMLEAGIILNQDYVNNSGYFAEDYVGDKRIF